jgi:signal transduction histidine kinase
MIQHELWYSNFYFVVDPALKGFDRSFYQFIETEMSEMGMNSYAEKNPGHLPLFIFYKDSHFAKEFDNENSFFIEVVGANVAMDFMDAVSIESFKVHGQEDWRDIETFIKMVMEVWVTHNREKLYQKSEKSLKKLLAPKRLSGLSAREFPVEFQKIEKQLISCAHVDEARDIFNKNAWCIKNKISIIRIQDYFKEGDMEAKAYPFFFGSGNVWLLKYQVEQEALLPVIYGLLYESFLRFYSIEEMENELSSWEKIFGLIEIPLAVFDESQQVLVHNPHFLRLNLSQKRSLSLVDGEQIEVDDRLFKVQKQEIKNNGNVQTLLYFLPVDDSIKGSHSSAEELGIVSSSLAHELNNPLAGILAALTVLGMDEVTEEMQQRMEEMKNGVNRCKQLVETFLGFSKVRSTHMPQIQNNDIEIRRTFDQAMELMRFRMIENNLKFNIDYHVKSSFLSPFNPSVISMLFYLVLGEVVTAFSHHMLVAETKKDIIPLKIVEEKNKITIFWADGVNLSNEFKKSKLIQHLFESQHAKASFSDCLELSFS